MKKSYVGIFIILLTFSGFSAKTIKADQQAFQVLALPTLPNATVGQSYSTPINFVYSGSCPIVAHISGYPPGINLSSPSLSGLNSGQTTLYGTPSQGGKYTIFFSLTDGCGASISYPFSLVVKNQSQFSGVDSSLPDAIVGIPYNAKINFTYSGFYTPTVNLTGLPGGITASSAISSNTTIGDDISGKITSYSITLSGTAQSQGNFQPLMNLYDGTGANYSLQYTLLVSWQNSKTTIPTPTPTISTNLPTLFQTSNTNQLTRNMDSAGTNISSNGTIYFITSDGKKRPYTSAGAFLSYGFNSWANVIPANPTDLSLPSGDFIPPRDGKIICSDRGSDKGTCYLITNSMKAAFTSAKVFKDLGFNFSNTLKGDVSFLNSAPNISNTNQAHSKGVLINKSGTIYLVGDNSLLGIANMDVLASWGYSLTDAVKANVADSVLPQSGVMAIRTAGALSPFTN